jgi:2-polyprenyl-3-methyl-5-hydroxy-6-metoxy-1,4-benzoquinol methylase
MNKILRILKKLPIDLGQADLSEVTEGKQIALRLVPHESGGKALDIGCREGYQSEWLKKLGYSVDSVDIETNYHFGLVLDVNNGLPYDDNLYDLVWCSEVIEHLKQPSYVLSEMRRVIKPGGTLILTIPNSNFWLYRILGLFGISPRQLQNPTHLHFFSLKDIAKLCPNANILGFFPYLILKFTIQSLIAIDLLSPTFIIKEKKA